MAIYAAVTMIVHAVQGHGYFDPTVLIAGISALLALLTRHVVTPLADPKNEMGVPLSVPENTPPAWLGGTS